MFEAALVEQRDAIAKWIADYRSAYIGQVKFP
jgi:hypothetical protein